MFGLKIVQVLCSERLFRFARTYAQHWYLMSQDIYWRKVKKRKKVNWNVTWKVAMGERSPWRVRLKPRGRPECAGWRLRCLRGRRHTGPERGEGPGLTTRCPARTSAQCGSEDVPPTSANSPKTKQQSQSVRKLGTGEPCTLQGWGGEMYGSLAQRGSEDVPSTSATPSNNTTCSLRTLGSGATWTPEGRGPGT